MYFASLLSAPKRAWRYVWAGEFKGSGPYTVADGMVVIDGFNTGIPRDVFVAESRKTRNTGAMFEIHISDHITAFYRDCSETGTQRYEVRRKHIHHPFVRIKENCRLSM